MWKFAGGVLLVILAALVWNTFRTPDRSLDSIPPRVSSQEEQDALDGLQLDYKIRKVGFGSVLEVDATIKNTSVYAVKDIDIVCRVFGNSGTELGEQRLTLYELVVGESTKKFPQLNFGLVQQQAKRAACKIESAKLYR